MSRLLVAAAAVYGCRWLEIRDVVEAQVALLRAQAMRWIRPLGELVDVAVQPAPLTSTASSAERETGDRFAVAVNRATRYGIFHPRCLARAVALSQLLDARGIHGHRIRIGVQRTGGRFTAHAWVELGPWVLGDTPQSTVSYVPLTEVCVVSRSHASAIPGIGGSAKSHLPGGQSLWDQ